MLASGRGSNLGALIAASDEGGYEVVAVGSDKPDAAALQRAVRAGIPTFVVAWSDYSDRQSFSMAVADALEAAGAAWVVLAGFMRVLSSEAVDRFAGRMVNVHPSLLPAFRGSRAVQQALDAGVAHTGATVHLVTTDVDAGPILAQEAVPILPGDDVSSLHARIQQVEHRILPGVMADLVSGRLPAGSRG